MVKGWYRSLIKPISRGEKNRMLIAPHTISVHAVTNDTSLRNMLFGITIQQGAHFWFVVSTSYHDQTKESIFAIMQVWSDRGGL